MKTHSSQPAEEGPMLEGLLRRLAECPPDFWETCPADELAQAAKHALAIACDQMRAVQAGLPVKEFATKLAVESGNHAAAVAVTAWLLHDPWFVLRPQLLPLMQSLYCSRRLRQLASMVLASRLAADPDRREELVRVCLDELGHRPAGETVEQSGDRLTTLDSVERQRVLKATRAAEQRARDVREAMAKARAQESASRYGE